MSDSEGLKSPQMTKTNVLTYQQLLNPASPSTSPPKTSSHTQMDATPKDETLTPSTPPRNTSSSTNNSPQDIIQGRVSHSSSYTHEARIVLPPMTPSTNTHKRSDSMTRLGNIPMTPMTKLLHDDTHGETPLRSPSNVHDDEDGKPPIRQITNKLRTRLNYAMVKFSNGWTDQSLDELERNFAEGSSNDDQAHLTISKSSLLKSPTKVTKPTRSNILLSPRKGSREHRKSMEPLDAGGSASAAFLHAISKSGSPKRRNFHNGLRIVPISPSSASSSTRVRSSQDSPEAEAIETLMSLSSPRSSKVLEFPPVKLQPQPQIQPKVHGQSSSSTQSQTSFTRGSLPRQKLEFGDNDESAIYQTESDDTEPEDAMVDVDARTDSAPGTPS